MEAALQADLNGEKEGSGGEWAAATVSVRGVLHLGDPGPTPGTSLQRRGRGGTYGEAGRVPK